jgi:3-phenylpropionate/cinnamic acid dioxygenase small subunit
MLCGADEGQMSAYYNEIDRYCCDWLQNLMDAGHITPGKIDDRSISEVSPEDLRDRVAKLRTAGNAIVPQVAAEFIKAAMI